MIKTSINFQNTTLILILHVPVSIEISSRNLKRGKMISQVHTLYSPPSKACWIWTPSMKARQARYLAAKRLCFLRSNFFGLSRAIVPGFTKSRRNVFIVAAGAVRHSFRGWTVVWTKNSESNARHLIKQLNFWNLVVSSHPFAISVTSLRQYSSMSWRNENATPASTFRTNENYG